MVKKTRLVLAIISAQKTALLFPGPQPSGDMRDALPSAQTFGGAIVLWLTTESDGKISMNFWVLGGGRLLVLVGAWVSFSSEKERTGKSSPNSRKESKKMKRGERETFIRAIRSS
ncbi:MAG: hypothetical protein CM15mV40_030 [Caudoviricetes sp.]|nr:MAG: hypothetical protein CM15mV40_030 [Caudoviricetes sp.]